MSLSTIRAGLKAALASNNKYSILDHVPEAVIPPAVLLTAGSPWLEPVVIGNNRAFYVRYGIECVSLSNSNPGSLEMLEDMVKTVLGLLPTNWIILDVGTPRNRTVNSTELLAAEITIQSTYNP
jgi:hypothetical protein